MFSMRLCTQVNISPLCETGELKSQASRRQYFNTRHSLRRLHDSSCQVVKCIWFTNNSIGMADVVSNSINDNSL